MERIYAGVGARATPPRICRWMARIAGTLARRGWRLRSGAAKGADSAFEMGARAAGGRREIYLPFDGFNGRKASQAEQGLGLHVGSGPKAVATARRVHPAPSRLRDGSFVLEAMARNTYQVLGNVDGREPALPSACVVCWTPGGRTEGGTGQAIRLAALHGIPVVNLGSEAWRREAAAPREVREAVLATEEEAAGGARC